MPPIEVSVDPALTELAERFTHWRQTRSSSHDPIPAPLWDQAVALCQRLPRGQVARALGLSATDLKHPCRGQPNPRVVRPACAPQPLFVELPAPPAHPAGPGGRIVGVEVERADGVRLRVTYDSAQRPGLAERLRAFLEPAGC